jgi:membrane-bound lytic murein transglycosylase B
MSIFPVFFPDYRFSAAEYGSQWTAPTATLKSDLHGRFFVCTLWFASFAVAIVTAAPCQAATGDYADRDAFATEVAQKHGLNDAKVRHILRQAKVQPSILRAIAQPSTAKPWYLYRNGVVDNRRIEAGVRFWRDNEAVLERASTVSGVPPELIVATLGAETFYGRNTGGYRVLDALVTLAFHYPARAELFRAQLEAFLLLAAQEGLDPLAVRGSYAGAMGLAQFLPSSYLNYAVDFDGNGRRDLWRTADAIGSVANYYQVHGWETGGHVVVTGEVDGTEFRALLDQGLKPHLALARLRQLGVTPAVPAAEDTLVALIEIQTEAGPRYLVGFQNFYVITRYNRSVNYALSVYELAREIRRQREAGPADR